MKYQCSHSRLHREVLISGTVYPFHVESPQFEPPQRSLSKEQPSVRGNTEIAGGFLCSDSAEGGFLCQKKRQQKKYTTFAEQKDRLNHLL